MAYNNAIPQANDQISVSQDDLLQNFAAIKTLVDVNHVTFSAVGEGKHKFVTFPRQGSAPATAATDLNVYSKLNANTSQSELYLRRDSGAESPITARQATTNGWSYLASGILIKWGTQSVAHNAQTTITFPVGAGIPVFSAVYLVHVSPATTFANSPGQVNRIVATVTNTGFDVYASGFASLVISVDYIAIGYGV